MLFATETAVRVLDIQAMNWVLQFDCPEEANSYSQSVQTCQVDDEALLILLPSEEKKNGAATSWVESAYEGNKNQSRKMYGHLEKEKKKKKELESSLAQDQLWKERGWSSFVSFICKHIWWRMKDHWFEQVKFTQICYISYSYCEQLLG